MPDVLRIVIPGDDPPQIQGSPHLKRLEAYGDIILYTDRPKTTEEKKSGLSSKLAPKLHVGSIWACCVYVMW